MGGGLRPARPLSGRPVVWNDKRTPPGQYSTVEGGQPADIDGRPVVPAAKPAQPLGAPHRW